MRVVLDTNILISALGWKGNEYNLMKKCMKEEITLIISLDILEEFREVALRPKFRFEKEEIEEFIDAMIRSGEVIQPTKKINIIKEDPSDNRILECAIEGKAKYIISGDNHLLKLEEFEDIKIIKSGEFLEILEGN